jgi:hypothetical protein
VPGYDAQIGQANDKQNQEVGVEQQTAGSHSSTFSRRRMETTVPSFLSVTTR